MIPTTMAESAIGGSHSFRPRLLPVETLAYRSESVWIGSFHCPTNHPLFVDSGPASAHLFVFPRTSVRIQHLGQEPFLAGPNVATFYNPCDEYRRAPVSPEGDQCDWFALAPELVAEVVGQEDPRAAEHPEKAFRFTHAPCDAPSYLEQRLALLNATRDATRDSLYVEETAVRLLERLVREFYATRVTNRPARQRGPALRRRHAALVEAAQSVLADRYWAPLSLPEIARAVGSSVYHLCRTFRETTGSSLHAYRNQLRLRRSLALLSGGREITDIALELGYSSHSHFTFAFRRAFGTTPVAFRTQAFRDSRR
jgi:AraC family transcriptional regulator